MTDAKFSPWNSAAFLETAEDIASYLEAAFEDGDPALITHALGVVTRSKGMSAFARETGLGRQNLYKALSANVTPGILHYPQHSPRHGPRLTVLRFEGTCRKSWRDT